MDTEPQLVSDLPVLRTPMDWHFWIGLIEKTTVIYGIWEYMDPDLKRAAKSAKSSLLQAPYSLLNVRWQS